MNSVSIRRCLTAGLVALSLMLVLATTAGAESPNSRRALAAGAVFTATNAADGNVILAYSRNAFGRLRPAGAYPTGGDGSGGGLGNQGGVVLDEEGRHLLAVNAGSDSISVFAVGPHGLRRTDVEPSGGVQPISIAVNGDLVYVLNAASGSIAGFELTFDGQLVPLAGSTRALTGAGPAEIGLSPDGGVVIVSEKPANLLESWTLDAEGLPVSHTATPSEGATPFGFSFARRGTLVVSEASGGAPNASTFSSYHLNGDGEPMPITSALPNGQSAACWVVATQSGRFVYATNTGSDTVSSFFVDRRGSLHPLTSDGVAATTGPTPIDAAISRNSRFLYVLNSGDGSLSTYAISPNGQLHPRPGVDGLPPSTNGLAAL